MIVSVGGISRQELIEKLHDQQIQVNEYGWLLINHERMTIAEKPELISIVDVTVSELGFKNGARSCEFIEQALSKGLGYCPLELAPFFRLQYQDQPEGFIGFPETRHRAPEGSLTVISRSPDDDPDSPAGFYLRKIRGELWLRGYLANKDHIWSPDDHLVFRDLSETVRQPKY